MVRWASAREGAERERRQPETGDGAGTSGGGVAAGGWVTAKCSV